MKFKKFKEFKKFQRFRTLAALLIASAILAACSTDDGILEDNLPATGQYTITIQATKDNDDTRALTLSNNGKKLNATWTQGDEVILSLSNDEASVGGSSEVTSWTLTATNVSGDGTKATLTGTITQLPTVNQTLYLSLKNDANYKSQKGTLDYIASHCDRASAEVTVEEIEAVTDGGKTEYQVTTTPASFQNEQAIVKFTLKKPDADGTLLKATSLTISEGKSVKATLTDIPAATYVTNGNGILYVAIPYIRNVVKLEAIDGNDTYAYYCYENSSANFQNGKFYDISVKMKQGNVDLSTLTADYEAKKNDVLYGTLADGVKLFIKDGAEVILNQVTIPGADEDEPEGGTARHGIECLGSATITLMGENSVTAYYKGAGIFVHPNKKLTIQGDGTLYASGKYQSAGIGGSDEKNCGNIEIKSGTVYATGSVSAAGIGAGRSASCGNISISGGTVTANGGSQGAGIGTGRTYETNVTCGSITISGGTVTATGGKHGAGIGSGNAAGEGTNQCGTITISGGTVTATGGRYGAGIGTGTDASCGTITIWNTVTQVTATKGQMADYSIGRGNGGSCGTVIIGGTEHGGINKSPYTYQP